MFWFICAFPFPTLSQLHSDSCVWGLGSYPRIGGQNRRLLPCSSKLPGFQCYPPGCVLLTLAHTFQKTHLWSWRQHVIDVKNSLGKKVYTCSPSNSFGKKGRRINILRFLGFRKRCLLRGTKPFKGWPLSLSSYWMLWFNQGQRNPSPPLA